MQTLHLIVLLWWFDGLMLISFFYLWAAVASAARTGVPRGPLSPYVDRQDASWLGPGSPLAAPRTCAPEGQRYLKIILGQL